ncbi:hypothetical protein ACOME3_009054 [Neoechinorhynchus agilis]
MFSQPPSVATEDGIRQSNSLKIKVPPDIRRHLLSDRSEGDIRPPTKLQTSSSIGDTHKIIYFDRPVKKDDYVTKISVIPIASKEATWGCFLKPWLNTKKDSILRIRSTSFWNGTLKIVFVNKTEMDDFESFVNGRHDEKIPTFNPSATKQLSLLTTLGIYLRLIRFKTLRLNFSSNPGRRERQFQWE